MAAMQRGDVPAVVAMLTEDAAWSMPPLESWYRGADLPGFLANGPLSGAWRWKHIPAWANGQPAIGCYTWVPAEGCFRPFALDVLTLRGERIAEVCAFIVRSTEGLAPEDFQRWPHLPCDERRVADVFGRAGLPDRLA
jgi:RNA polymerase sigma-70 factor (ECF subfamily)